MPISTVKQRSPEDRARLGNDFLHRRIEPLLSASDKGKFVAIDIDSFVYEIDEDDHAAVTRLLARQPSADIWLACVGYKTTCRIGMGR